MNTDIESIQKSSNPLVRRKARMLRRIVEALSQFKSIDIAFLQMRGASDMPTFAVLPFEFYKQKRMCHFTGYAYGWDGTPPGMMVSRFPELFMARGGTSGTAIPKSDVPASIDAIVDEVKNQFDELLVVWEADWQPAKGDPIVIGRIDDVYFIVASWDLTELESFIIDEHGGKHQGEATTEP